MSTVVAFVAEKRGNLDQEIAQLQPFDHVVTTGRKTFGKFTELLACYGLELKSGDRVKFYDLRSVTISTTSLIRAIVKMVNRGISVEIISPALLISPDDGDRLRMLITALDNHYRFQHGIKTHPAERRGRRSLLRAEQFPDIRAKLDVPGATTGGVAKELGVARSTLFNYLERYDRDRRAGGGKEIEEGQSQGTSDDIHVAKGEVSDPSVQDV